MNLKTYRRVSFEEDGVPDGTGFMIRTEISKMIEGKSGTIDETMTAIDRLDRELAEHVMKTGRPVVEEMKATVMWQIMDPNTRSNIDMRLGPKEEDRKYANPRAEFEPGIHTSLERHYVQGTKRQSGRC